MDEKELEQLKRDAARYRFMRDCEDDDAQDAILLVLERPSDEWDAALDALMADFT